MSFLRLTDEGNPPSEQDILGAVGRRASLWTDLQDHLKKYSDFKPHLIYYGRKYGWTLRYSDDDKTLCSLFPEQGAFTVLIILGKKELPETVAHRDDLSPYVRMLFENTKQMHDGRWLWIPILTSDDLDSIKLLLRIKQPLPEPE